MGAPTVVFAGLATWDVIQLVERVPHADEKVAALGFVAAAGGPAANAAVAAARLGSRPTLVTALPRHPLSALITEDLSRCGVEVAVAARYAGTPITASILVTAGTGERAVVSPTHAATHVELEPTSGVSLNMDNVLCVLVDGYFRSVAVPIARAARERSIPVILDAGSVKPSTEQLLEHVDVAVVSQAFRPPGTGGEPHAVLAYLRSHGVSFAAITRGGSPILYADPAGAGEVAVEAVDGVVDTLGAGDFFHGALAHRIASRGLSAERFADDLAFAAQEVAASLTSLGTRDWLARRP